MPRPPRPWFRFYSEIADNPKFHAMPDKLVKPWVILLSLANSSKDRGRLPALDTIAFKLRVKHERAQAILAELLNLHWIDEEDGHYVMHDWDDWQYESDAGLTPGRAGKNEAARNAEERTPKERAKNAESPRLERVKNANHVLSAAQSRADTEKEKETEADADAEAEDARPPEHPFAFMYAQKYRMREGRPIPPVVHAAALALEREFGSQACIDAAADFDWQKHPNYLKPGLEERKRDAAREPVTVGAPARKSLRYDD